MTREFAGKIAIVTGAGSGIGKATAQLLGQKGASVLCADVNAAALKETVMAMTASGATASASPTDVSVAAKCEAATRAAVELGGGVDVLVNVAGIMNENDTVESTPEEAWDRILAVNLKSVFLMSKYAIPEMRRRGGGVIVNTASVHAFANMPESASYAASKGGIIALTRQMANDLACDLIRVVAVAPGSVDTPLSHTSTQRLGKTLEELGFSFDPRVLGRVAQPDEIAQAIVWLASDAASFVNGTTLVADGGLLAKLV